MKTKKCFTLKAVLITMALATGFVHAQDPQDEYKLLFIGIDGVRADALQQLMDEGLAPNMEALFETGTYTFDSWHLGVTSSGPSWSDMLTGVWEEKHNVYSNSYTGSNYDDYPYFVTRVKECRPGAKAVQVTSWSPMSDNVYNDGWDNKLIPPTDDACVMAASAQLLDAALDILFVHIDDVDAAGHGNGFNPAVPAYMNAIKYADQQVGEILEALYARPNYSEEKWVIMLTTDHGGTGTTHGGNSDDERHIWWVANGYGIPSMEITGTDPGSYQFGPVPDMEMIQSTPVLTDIAATAIDHVLPDDVCEEENAEAWDLDGKSWLDTESLYIEGNNLNDPIGVKAYPNPNNGIFDVVVDMEEGKEFQLTITDLAGKEIYNEDLLTFAGYSKLKVDLTSFKAGTYLMTLTGDDRTVTKKIIKQ